ncbi:hypothetical protein AXK11_05340 [Cephaloticoccus primus]|uniref:DUF2264 domain-containing protein n=1 Tax=Cephaloticoccus primus TaxID=1548207 RepID=A0A139SN45_9BACT|nr:hypothetical protein AXK11_05340 [Cephaloticoccus primus]
MRAQWCEWATRLAQPIFDALDKRELKLRMPVETRASRSRAPVAHLEALGRLLVGLSPWLELGPDDTPEGQLRGRLAVAARRAIDAATDPDSPDKMNFSTDGQPLVDAAFLAQATFRAPRELWEKLEPRVQANLTARLKETRHMQPGENNWQLFAAFVELALARGGEPRDDSRILPALEKFKKWYLGDGTYGDGPEHRWDYYNSFVIHPMLLGILDEAAQESDALRQFQKEAQVAARRYAAVQERLVAPDGSFPAIGRSIVYRCGALQALADVALRRELPDSVPPAAARTALTRAIRRTLDAPGTFDENGWLRLGLAGHQPSLAEFYICTGSLYLCSVALLPLGLPPEAPFWSDPHAPTTWERIWGGEDIPADGALHGLPPSLPEEG